MALDSAELGTRVAEARQRAGLKQDDLARAVGMDRSAVAKIETGARRITALELARVSEALGERIEWFVYEAPVAIISHRNVADPGEPSPRIDSTIDRAVRAVEFIAEHDYELEHALGRLETYPEPRNKEDADGLAARARDLLSVSSQEPLYDLSAKLMGAGIITFVIDVGVESADAASVLLRNGAVALVNGALRTGRRRLSLAHELGHILIADEYTVDWRVDSSSGSDRREQVLDQFARALLLPSAGLREKWQEWGGNDTEGLRSASIRVASHFRVDMSTLARRLVDLGIVDGLQAAHIRSYKTNRADIVEHGLVVADELRNGELPRDYEAAVIRLFKSETISDVRALDLLFDTWDLNDLPPLPPLSEGEIWQFVS